MTSSRPKLRHTALYLTARLTFAAGSRLPLGLIRPLGAQLGLVALLVSVADRRRARDHLGIAFPDLGEAAARRLLRQTARHLGMMLSEMVWLWRASTEQVAARCTADGLEHLERALAEGRGGVLVTGHCGNWEMISGRIAGVAGIPLTFAVRELYDPRLDTIATAVRARFGTQIVPRNVNAGVRLARALKRNRFDGFLIDQDIRDLPGAFVPFFGRPAWTPAGAAALALRQGCPTMAIFSHRRKDLGHHVTVHPPMPVPDSGSPEDRIAELTATATAAIERQIRAHPEQWVWMHRRWRTRPGESSGSGVSPDSV